MKIKVKLVLGIGLLFAMITLQTVLSSWSILRLSAETKNILVANYNTLDYSRNMLIALNKGLGDPANQKLFAENLMNQQSNITEDGEEELTAQLSTDYQAALTTPHDSMAQRRIQNDISAIMLLNMLAIQRKSNSAQATAERSILWVGFVGGICFFVAFSVLINLPGNIANPIRELTASIKGIAAHNYDQRVHFESHNEFGELAQAFNSMAQKLQEYSASNLAQLMLEKKRVETLIDNLRDPVIELDQDKHILYLNQAAVEVTGLKREMVLGKPVLDIAVENDLMRILVQDLFNPDPPAVPAQESQPIKIYMDHKESYFEKEIIPLLIKPTGEKQNVLLGHVILLQNITAFKELDFAKTHFIATVSHELKTPLASIQMSLQLLEKNQIGPLNADQANLLRGIGEDTQRLLAITSELLKFTQLESGAIQLLAAPVSHQEILNYAVGITKLMADQKNILVTIQAPPEVPLILADREKTAWVITNLLSNAIRYAYENTEVLIEVVPQGNQVRFHIIDHGPGIAKEYQDKIFNRYFRAPGSTQEGSGLGLSICKEFIIAQGGQIGVESELGLGSKFFITLPAYVNRQVVQEG